MRLAVARVSICFRNLIEIANNLNTNFLTHLDIFNRLKVCGIITKHYVPDNECSTEFKKAINDNEMPYKLVPHNDHCQKIVERAIQTAKSYVVSVLCGVDPNFPMHLWDLLILQREIHLNLLWQLRTVPKISA